MKNEAFKKNLHNMMAKKGCNQDDIARTIGVAPSTVSHWYLGISIPRGDTLLKLAQYLGTSPSMLIEEKATFNLMDEERILHYFRTLSPKGKEEALKRMQELTQIYWYSKGENVAKSG